ncbi:hypothetical protein DVQ85_19725 [Yersinia enterocolitica]|nr:hypothetical protein [Yersinia enterocolitica]EKN5987715.1 hypothetical protein [Yersinia enterocolitica]
MCNSYPINRRPITAGVESKINKLETEQNFTALVETLPLIRPLNRIKKEKKYPFCNFVTAKLTSIYNLLHWRYWQFIN